MFAGAGAILVAATGAAVTDLGPWYWALHVPPWKPPDWAFGPAWTVVFTGSAISAVRAWRASRTRGARRGLIGLWLLNAALNVGWSVLFFRWRRPDAAFIEAFALWLSIAALMVHAWRRDRTAALLLLPYLGWVSLATCLTGTIAALNPR
ncbi:MAG: tryptophan-rich sensory protein [Proteobacteria bacterium]|nr:tryptophan-rich sensory protein [Pseudomonadota bacterium]